MRLTSLIVALSISFSATSGFAMQQQTITETILDQTLQEWERRNNPGLWLAGFVALCWVLNTPEKTEREREIDLWRGVQEDSRIAKAKAIMKEMLDKYRSSQDYSSDADLPYINDATVIAFLRSSNLGALQTLLIRAMEKIVQDRSLFNFRTRYPHVRTQNLVFSSSLVHVLGHGECGNLANYLIIEFMKAGFPKITRAEILEEVNGITADHAYVILEDEHGVEWGFDPYYRLVLPLEELQNSEIFLSYFRKMLNNPTWIFIKNTNEVDYKHEDYSIYLNTLLDQLNVFLDTSSEDIEIKRIQEHILEIMSAKEVKDLYRLLALWTLGDEAHRLSSLVKYPSKLAGVYETVLLVLTFSLSQPGKWVIDLKKNAAWLKLDLSQQGIARQYQAMFETHGVAMEFQLKEKSCFLVLKEIRNPKTMEKLIQFIVDFSKMKT